MKALILLVLVSAPAFAGGYEPGEVDYVNGRSDSVSYTNIGNSSFGSDGSSYSKIGGSTYSGSSDSHVGDAAFDSNSTRIGDSVFGSDGSSCTKIGSTAFCN